jgi:mRNA-degrading endonuclease RelE of RelBE toxin-antitoxin system
LDRWIPIDTSPFKRDYKRLRNTQIQQKVKNGIRGIVESDNPREQGEHKVNNLDCIYGYEIGLKYRILYEVFDKEREIVFYRVGLHDIYKTKLRRDLRN